MQVLTTSEGAMFPGGFPSKCIYKGWFIHKLVSKENDFVKKIIAQ